MSRRILVLDGDCGASISIVQSLGRANYHVTVAGTSLHHRAFHSRYARAKATYPDPLTDRPSFQRWAEAQGDYALIIPATERTLMPLHQIRDSPSLAGRIALPPAVATNAGFDKERVRALAEQLGIPVPINRVVDSIAGLASPTFDEWLAHGAVVIKGVRSKVWEQGGGRELVVQMAVTREQLEIFAGQMLESGPVQCQRWVPGHGRGLGILVDQGEVVRAFAHERLHELPLTGGGSCYRRSIEPPPDLLEWSKRLLRALGWHGVAMVEFRYDPWTGKSHMMELNGRFWGSLPLAQFAGVDFPLALVELLLDGKRPAPVTALGVYARAFRQDIQWLKGVVRVRAGDLRRRGPVPPERRLMLLRPIVRSVIEWSRVVTGREVWDGAALDDPGPILFEIAQQFTGGGAWLRARWRRRKARREAIAAWSRPLGEVKKVLVLCSGNICRSAYVGVKLADALRGRGIDVRSGALVGPGGRLSPRVFAAASSLRGVDLSGHRSYAISEDDLAWADLILIMDQDHDDGLRRRSPASMAKTLWLGGVAARAGADPTIPDPVDFGAAQTGRVLDFMDSAIASLVSRLV